MAIIENRMSTVPVPDLYIPPDDIPHDLLRDYEAGPIAVGDPTSGQAFQTWILTWASGTGDFTITPQTVGAPVVVLNAAGVEQIGLAFDQNGQPTVCYNTATNGFLYWFDSAEPGFVTTDFGTSVFSLALTLDDKRDRQTQANDVILWYTKTGAVDFDLFNRVQRERYTAETLMATRTLRLITHVGMHVGWRLQVSTSGTPTPTPPADPPTVESPTFAAVTDTTATLGGDVTSDGGAVITERGTVWALTADPDTGDDKDIVAGTTGVFTGPVTGLPAETLIHYRAYAINSEATAYSADDTFTTEAAATTLLVDLVSWWAMEEASSTRSDSHGTNDLTEIGSISSTTGIVNDGADMPGAGSLFQSSSSDFQINSGDFSFSTWIKAASFPFNTGYIGKNQAIPTQSAYYIWAASAGRLDWAVRNDTGTVFSVNIATAVDTWHHVVVWYNGATKEVGMRMDDTTTATTTLTGTFSDMTSGSVFAVGTYASSAQSYTGQLDEVAFWTKVLSPAEITELYNAGAGITYTDL